MSAILSTIVPLNSPQCILALLGLAYAPHMFRTYGVVRPKFAAAGKPYDIKYTRQCVAQATDGTPEGLLIARLTGAHQNSLEALGYFSAAVAMALASGMPRAEIDTHARLFVAIRAAYTLVYASDRLNGPLRSLLFMGGMGTAIALLWKAGKAYSSA